MSINKNYEIINKLTSKSGNSAIASAKAGIYLNGTCVNSITETVTLTCSANGTLK